MKKISDSEKIVKLILKVIILTKKGFKLSIRCTSEFDTSKTLAISWEEKGKRKYYAVRIND